MDRLALDIRPFDPQTATEYSRSAYEIYCDNENFKPRSYEKFTRLHRQDIGYAALSGEVMVGVAFLRMEDKDDPMQAQLDLLAVAQNHQHTTPGTGHGVGTRLLERVEADVKDAGKVALILFSSELALPFYEQHRYHAIGASKQWRQKRFPPQNR